MTIEVSAAGFDQLDLQIRDALSFLGANFTDVHQLSTYPGVELVTLDFGIHWRDAIVQSDLLPAELVALAGKLGLAIEVTHYVPWDDEPDAC